MLNLARAFPDPSKLHGRLTPAELEQTRRELVELIDRDWAFVLARKGDPENDPTIRQLLDELLYVKSRIAALKVAREPSPPFKLHNPPMQLALWG